MAHKAGIGPKGTLFKIHIETGHNNTDALIGQLLTKPRPVHCQKIELRQYPPASTSEE
jgi:hypothetical protein